MSFHTRYARTAASESHEKGAEGRNRVYILYRVTGKLKFRRHNLIYNRQLQEGKDLDSFILKLTITVAMEVATLKSCKLIDTVYLTMLTAA